MLKMRWWFPCPSGSVLKSANLRGILQLNPGYPLRPPPTGLAWLQVAQKCPPLAVFGRLGGRLAQGAAPPIFDKHFPLPWSTSFEDPIPLPDGRRLLTLRDAASYITKPNIPAIYQLIHLDGG